MHQPDVSPTQPVQDEPHCKHGWGECAECPAAPSVSTDHADEQWADGPDLDMLEEAWGIIANATSCWTDPDAASPGWLEAAERWRDKYHGRLAARRG